MPWKTSKPNQASSTTLTQPARLGVAAVRSETRYDQVTSLLMATIVGAILIVLWLSLVYLTNRSLAARVTSPIEIIEVYGGAGGTPEGEVGSTEKIDVADAAAEAMASNNELEPADFEDPSLQQMPNANLDALMDATDRLADLAEEMESGGATATGRRASKIGSGGPGYGFGAGDGGVPREQRWSILYRQGQTIDEYARQLDALEIEMGTILDGQMHYASNFSAPRPRVRTGSGQGDNRLYFLWQGGERKESDVALLAKAGITVGPRSPIFQFFPARAENELAQLEVAYRGLKPSEIRVTRYTVVPRGRTYGFQVLDQQPLD